MYVADTPSTDIVGSRNAGMRSAWINSRRLAWPSELEPADIDIDSLVDLPEVLVRL